MVARGGPNTGEVGSLVGVVGGRCQWVESHWVLSECEMGTERGLILCRVEVLDGAASLAIFYWQYGFSWRDPSLWVRAVVSGSLLYIPSPVSAYKGPYRLFGLWGVLVSPVQEGGGVLKCLMADSLSVSGVCLSPPELCFLPFGGRAHVDK